MKNLCALFLVFIVCYSCSYPGHSFSESFPVFKQGAVPSTVDELWEDINFRKEALETEVLMEWEEDSVIVKIIRFRIGIFKGQTARMAAIFGYPAGAKKLPGLVQIHGGGHWQEVVVSSQKLKNASG